ncbi:MAG: hypothetical protein JXB18_03960 [Sedimentisphaerales bacterium]|nr:hypothetical protein [Sedimentisphaerales bacterium]
MTRKSEQSPKARRLGWLAGLFSGWSARKIEPTQQDVANLDFPSSSQKMGVRFSEKVREVFRFRWIRKR